MIEHDREIVVDDGAMRRIVIDLEMAVGERQPVHRLSGAGHDLGHGPDERGETGNALARRRGARQGNRRRARIVRDRKRQRAVSRDTQAQVKSIELEPPDLDLEQRQREGVEADLAARRREDRSPGGVAHGQALEAQAHAPGIVHEVGRSEGDCVAVADALLQRGFDLVVQADEPNGPARQHRGQRQPAHDKKGRRKFRCPEKNVGDPAGADAAPARRKARTLAARRHAAHGGPGPRPRRHVKRTDQ